MKPIQEPLIHFVLAGAVLFGAYAWFNRGEDTGAPNNSKQIRIGVGEVQWLKETWALQRQRDPTSDELRGLLTEFVNEMMLAREAREMKLDDNDTIIRRRLAQKLNFLIENTLRLAEPSDAELQRLYDARPQRSQTAARISFTHVYFNPARRADAASDANAVLASLSDATDVGRADDIGDRFLLESKFRDEDERSVTGIFGPEFAHAVFALRPGVWSGPVASGFGLHLVHVTALQGSVTQPFSEMRGQLLEQWRRDQEQIAKERYFAELRKKYDVVIDDNVKPFVAPVTNASRATQ